MFSFQPYQYNYVHGTNATLGQTVLQNRAIHEANWWIWLGVGVMAAYVILFNVGVSLALAYLPRKSPALEGRSVKSNLCAVDFSAFDRSAQNG